jgi:hypothetical protein
MAWSVHVSSNIKALDVYIKGGGGGGGGFIHLPDLPPLGVRVV